MSHSFLTFFHALHFPLFNPHTLHTASSTLLRILHAALSTSHFTLSRPLHTTRKTSRSPLSTSLGASYCILTYIIQGPENPHVKQLKPVSLCQMHSESQKGQIGTGASVCLCLAQLCESDSCSFAWLKLWNLPLRIAPRGFKCRAFSPHARI